MGNNETMPLLPDSLLGGFTKPSESATATVKSMQMTCGSAAMIEIKLYYVFLCLIVHACVVSFIHNNIIIRLFVYIIIYTLYTQYIYIYIYIYPCTYIRTYIYYIQGYMHHVYVIYLTH